VIKTRTGMHTNLSPNRESRQPKILLDRVIDNIRQYAPTSIQQDYGKEHKVHALGSAEESNEKITIPVNNKTVQVF
jgi:hypothetical protein